MRVRIIADVRQLLSIEQSRNHVAVEWQREAMPLARQDRHTPRRQSDGGLLVGRGDELPLAVSLHAENVPAWIDNLVALKDVGRVNSSHQGDGAGRAHGKIGSHGVVRPVHIAGKGKWVRQWSPWNRLFRDDLFQATSIAPGARMNLEGAVLIGEVLGRAGKRGAFEVFAVWHRERLGRRRLRVAFSLAGSGGN